MKALLWYFGSPSEVRLTRASCCDGLHYGVYGLWGFAPTSPTGLRGKCPSLTGSPHARLLSSSLLQTDSGVNCRSSYIHKCNVILKTVSPSKSAVRNKYIMSLNYHNFHYNRFSYLTLDYSKSQPWLDPDSITAARPLLSPSGPDTNTVAAPAACPGGKGWFYCGYVL